MGIQRGIQPTASLPRRLRPTRICPYRHRHKTKAHIYFTFNVRITGHMILCVLRERYCATPVVLFVRKQFHRQSNNAPEKKHATFITEILQTKHACKTFPMRTWLNSLRYNSKLIGTNRTSKRSR